MFTQIFLYQNTLYFVLTHVLKQISAMRLAASKMRGVPPQMLELVAGLGEVWSAQTLSAYMKSTGAKCEWSLDENSFALESIEMY